MLLITKGKIFIDLVGDDNLVRNLIFDDVCCGNWYVKYQLAKDNDGYFCLMHSDYEEEYLEWCIDDYNEFDIKSIEVKGDDGEASFSSLDDLEYGTNEDGLICGFRDVGGPIQCDVCKESIAGSSISYSCNICGNFDWCKVCYVDRKQHHCYKIEN